MLSFIANSVKKIIPGASVSLDPMCHRCIWRNKRLPRLRGKVIKATVLRSMVLFASRAMQYSPHAEWRLVAGVELVVDFEHSFFKDMGIDLRGGDIGMTQHLLNRS